MSAKSGRDLGDLVEKFRRETGYPTEADEQQKRLQVEWREKLLPENIKALSREELAAVLNRDLWGNAAYVKPESASKTDLGNPDPMTYEHLLRTIDYLCWGEGELADRFDAVDDPQTLKWKPGRSGHIKVPGGYVSKLLALCHPGRILPISGQRKTKATRRAMLELMGLPSPQIGDSFGEQSIDANDRLREHLAPYFDDGPHAIASFLYWLVKQDHPPVGNAETHSPNRSGTADGGETGLTALAERLLVDVKFLTDIVELLEDKRQVILYGPPGTGKTYLAKELAKELAPDESRHILVQFHPSTSYEDFFEGYRPAGAGDGGIRYDLTPGPLARMAERAAEDPDERHVMVIDEINRGNLPACWGSCCSCWSTATRVCGRSIGPMSRSRCRRTSGSSAP